MYRYSYFAKYAVVTIETKRVTPVTIASDEGIVDVLQNAKWGPVGSSIVFVVQNNLFYKPNAEQSDYNRLTTDGRPGHIYNGNTDWVYEGEEICPEALTHCTIVFYRGSLRFKQSVLVLQWREEVGVRKVRRHCCAGDDHSVLWRSRKLGVAVHQSHSNQISEGKWSYDFYKSCILETFTKVKLLSSITLILFQNKITIHSVSQLRKFNTKLMDF